MVYPDVTISESLLSLRRLSKGFISECHGFMDIPIPCVNRYGYLIIYWIIIDIVYYITEIFDLFIFSLRMFFWGKKQVYIFYNNYQ